MTTIKYGMDGEVRKNFGDATVSDILEDTNLLSFLGAPDGSGLVAIANGVTLSKDEVVSYYDEIMLEKNASEKAV